jgi:ribonuclease HI|tara:strand:- start:1528 stop:1953 length:426 start_codon:yes stop_codon:yes gene_type:complete
MIKIYTDGSCLGNPGNGGWAAIINDQDKITKISGNKKNTTNNQMELMAAIEALKKIPTEQEVQLYTDSKYVKMGITEWIKKWSQNNWKTSSKQKVKNLELWKELNIISKKHKIKWFWVKSHAGNPSNEEVDVLAKKAANLV